MNSNSSVSNWYEEYYSVINISGDPKSLFFRKLHRLVEKYADSAHGRDVLEVGAGNGEHMAFVEPSWNSYICTDIREPNRKIKEEILNRGGEFKIADVHKLPFENAKFDRVISTCLFHHLDHPMNAMREILRVVKNGGQITILLPNDPGVLYRFVRKITTLKRAKKAGLLKEVELIHSLEHKNHFLSILSQLQNEIGKNSYRIDGFPFKGLNYNLNALQILNIRKDSNE